MKKPQPSFSERADACLATFRGIEQTVHNHTAADRAHLHPPGARQAPPPGGTGGADAE